MGQLSASQKVNSGTTLANWEYGYDPIGNVNSLHDYVGSATANISYLTTDRDNNNSEADPVDQIPVTEYGPRSHRTDIFSFFASDLFQRQTGNDGTFALVMEQALQRRRRAIDRHCELLAHHGYRHIDGFHAAQDVGHQVTALEARRVSAKRGLVVGATIDVVEDRSRQPPLGQLPEIMEVVTLA